MNNRYLTVAEAAREVTNVLGQYVDKTFVQMLCERKEIQASCIPARDCRKNDIFMIHEGQIDKICLALRGDEIVEAKKEEEKPMETREQFDMLEPGIRYLNTEEVAECLGMRRESVNNLIIRGNLPAKKVKRPANQGGKQPYVYMIDEADVEEKMKDIEKRRLKPAEVKEPEPVREHVFSQEFYDRLDSLKIRSDELHEKLDDLISSNIETLNTTKQMFAQACIIANDVSESNNSEIDISQIRMEAYKEGFKEGFKAAMEVK